MVTTTVKEELEQTPDSGGGGNDFNGRDGGGGDGGGGNDGNRGRSEPPDPYRTMVWLAMVPITITFIAIATTLLLLRFYPNAYKHWVTLKLPLTLWLSTISIIVSSVTIELARRALKGGSAFTFKRWWSVTLVR